ncbi:MAG: hypothetical protein JST35_07380 [Armatimonadetes bacterium]|nr:hypothetical protein [Armatimonadota bacterium]
MLNWFRHSIAKDEAQNVVRRPVFGKLRKTKKLAIQEVRRLQREFSLLIPPEKENMSSPEAVARCFALSLDLELSCLQLWLRQGFLTAPLEYHLTKLDRNIELVYEAELVSPETWNMDNLKAILDCKEIRDWEADSKAPFGLRKFIFAEPIMFVALLLASGASVAVIFEYPRMSKLGQAMDILVVILSIGLLFIHYRHVKDVTEFKDPRPDAPERDQTPS